jgi:hypothetical protein
MSPHTRWDIFHPNRYTAAQAQEMVFVHRLYERHLASQGFPGIDETPLALINPCEPRHGVSDYPFVLPPAGDSLALRVPAESLMHTLQIYLHRRDARWWYRGHDNDPTRLCVVFLMQWAQNLAGQPCTEQLATQVKQLQAFVLGLRTENQGGAVFKEEPQKGDQDMDTLITNVVNALVPIAHQINQQVALSSAREHFQHLREQSSHIVSDLMRYCFFVTADRPCLLHFSLFNMRTVLDIDLKKQLNTREGVLLQHVAEDQHVSSVLAIQESDRAHYLPEPVPVFIPGAALSYFDDNDAHAALCAALMRQSSYQLDPDFKRKPNLTYSKLEKPVIAQVVALYGYVKIFAQYYHYADAFWQLAGFGGDHLICQELAAVVRVVCTELPIFNHTLQKRLKQLMKDLQPYHDQVKKKGSHRHWQANLAEASRIAQRIEQSLAAANNTMATLLEKMSPTQMQANAQKASLALDKVQQAQRFLTQTRAQLGLPVKEFTPLNTLRLHRVTSEPVTPPAAHVRLDLEAALTHLLRTPHEPVKITRWVNLYQATQQLERLRWWHGRGTRARRIWVSQAASLQGLGDGLAQIAQHPTGEQVQALQTMIAAQQASIAHLRQPLNWLFQRQSRQFFDAFSSSLQAASTYLVGVEQALNAPAERVISPLSIEPIADPLLSDVWAHLRATQASVQAEQAVIDALVIPQTPAVREDIEVLQSENQVLTEYLPILRAEKSRFAHIAQGIEAIRVSL